MSREAPPKIVEVREPTRILVPVSGGKDSQMCMAMAVDTVGPARVLGIHQHTGFDHPDTYAHMDYMRERYGVDIINTKSHRYTDVPDVMMGEVMVPGRFARLCTRQLKTGPWFRWLAKQPDLDTIEVWLGMRASESQNRRENYGGLLNGDVYAMGDTSNECPASCRNVATRLPIVEVSTPSVFEFLRRRGDKINPLYKKGHKRVGCFPCVLAGKNSLRLVASDPVGRENLLTVQAAVQVIQWARQDSFFEHDLDDILSGRNDPFGLLTQDDDEQAGGCSWCNL